MRSGYIGCHEKPDMKYPTKRHLPSIVNLNTFEVISRRLSIKGAAEELSLTQSAVSRQLADLEKFVRVPLCRRTPSGLELTHEGAGYLRRVRGLLDEIESATISASMGAIPDKVLRISVPTTFGAIWAMPLLCEFSRQHPQWQLDITTHAGPISLKESSLDAAIIYCESLEEGCVGDLLHKLVSYPVAAPSLVRGKKLPLTAKQLAALPLLHQVTVPNAWPSYLREIGNNVHAPLPGPRLGLLGFASQAAQAGLGVALLPSYVCSKALTQKRLLKLHDTGFTSPRSYFFATLQDKASAPGIAALRAWLVAKRKR